MKGESERVIGLLENVAERERERMRDREAGRQIRLDSKVGRERERV